MELYCIFRFLALFNFFNLAFILCTNGEIRNGHYDLRDQDKGTSEGVLKVTSARSRLQCMTLCMATDQCVTAGYVDNQCTLSTKRINVIQDYYKMVSTGERLYSLRCVPCWSGMCSVMNVTGVAYGDCNGIYTLVDGIVADNRPVYMKGTQYRYLYYNILAWIIGSTTDGTGFHFCYVDNCAPEMPQCDAIQIKCLDWLD